MGDCDIQRREEKQRLEILNQLYLYTCFNNVPVHI